jgi:hypothetical protein
MRDAKKMVNILKPSQTPELIFGLVAPIGVELDGVTEVLTELLREVEYGTTLLRLTRVQTHKIVGVTAIL